MAKETAPVQTTAAPPAVIVEALDRQVSGRVTNPTAIEWPHDPYGITTALRVEGAKAVGRVHGDPDKLEVVIGVLRCLAEHGATCLEDQQNEAAQRAAALENQAAAAKYVARADAKRSVERLVKQLQDAEAKLAAFEAETA